MSALFQLVGGLHSGAVQRGDGIEQFAAEDLGFDGEATALLVVEENTPCAQLLAEDLVFRPQILDDLVLLLVHPAREAGQQQMPGLEDETAQRHA